MCKSMCAETNDRLQINCNPKLGTRLKSRNELFVKLYGIFNFSVSIDVKFHD